MINPSPYDVVGSMESPLIDCSYLCSALLVIAEGLSPTSGEHSRAIFGIAAGMKSLLDETEEKRRAVWRGLHPCRERFDREGWPGDADPDGKAVQP